MAKNICPSSTADLPIGTRGGTLVAATREIHAGQMRVRLAGEIDASNADRVHAVLSGWLADGIAGMCINMKAVTFIDCAGLAALRSLRSAGATGDPIRLEGAAHPHVRRLLELVDQTTTMRREGRNVPGSYRAPRAKVG